MIGNMPRERHRFRLLGPRTAVLVVAVWGALGLTPCERFSDADSKIRDGLLPRPRARQVVARLAPQLHDEFSHQGCIAVGRHEWVFPVEGYDRGAIGGHAGNGYIPQHYDYFDGNRHGGHPGHDIFIRDLDHDSMDDQTGLAVPVVSISSGLVVAMNDKWVAGSSVRGGKYVWIYDTVTHGLFYYAHLGTVSVSVGDCVTPGTAIGTVGRTGTNASPARSPTHLHLAYLRIVNGYPRPANIYHDLNSVRTKALVAH